MGSFSRQYSLNVIFISLSVRLQFFAAFGKFHFAANNISIDCRVSGLILVTLKNFFVKIGRIKIHKKVIGSKITGIFFARFLEIKVDFGQRGEEYASVSSSKLSRHNSSTAIN